MFAVTVARPRQHRSHHSTPVLSRRASVLPRVFRPSACGGHAHLRPHSLPVGASATQPLTPPGSQKPRARSRHTFIPAPSGSGFPHVVGVGLVDAVGRRPYARPHTANDCDYSDSRRRMPTSVRLDPAVEARLENLARVTRRSKAFYLRELIGPLTPARRPADRSAARGTGSRHQGWWRATPPRPVVRGLAPAQPGAIGLADGLKLLSCELQLLRQQQRREGMPGRVDGSGWRGKCHGHRAAPFSG